MDEPLPPKSTEDEIAWLKRRVGALEQQLVDLMLEVVRLR